MVSQPGLVWEGELLGLEPRWTVEPDIELVEKTCRHALPQSETCIVNFFGQGAFNKLYTVDSGSKRYMMRVSLPVDPKYKTLSEVATLSYVRRIFQLPVAKVIAYDASNRNDIGFEWILMELMPGSSLSQSWKAITWTAKEALVKRLAAAASNLFKKQFNGIGSLFLMSEWTEESPEWEKIQGDSDTEEFTLGRLVSLQFFWGTHISQDVPRGPFKKSKDWLLARLQFNENDARKVIEEASDGDEVEEAETILGIVNRLKPKVLETFDDGEEERTVLFHDDLSQSNILVDDRGELQAIVDWEAVAAVPLWKATQPPAFLEGRPRDENPLEESYAKEENGEVNELYWEHLLEYEQSQLRKVFMAEMETLEPHWIDVFHKGGLKKDMELAVHNCDNGFCYRIINEWLDDLDSDGDGKVKSLSARLSE